jgi:uncharacterized protein (DUF849 family)
VTGDRILLQAVLNGARSVHDHPGLPVTPEALVREARAAVAAGADAVHLHVRDGDGAESLEPDDVHRTLEAVRPACQSTPIGVSTGAWIVPDPLERLARIAAWVQLPDFASVNFHEARAADVAARLLDRGVGVEAGLWHPAAADLLVASGLGPRCLRILIEPMQPDSESALANAAAIEAVLDRAGVDRPRLLHGTGPTSWDLIRVAAGRRLATRVGLEDVRDLPDGSPAPDNAALVAAARAIVEAATP